MHLPPPPPLCPRWHNRRRASSTQAPAALTAAGAFFFLEKGAGALRPISCIFFILPPRRLATRYILPNIARSSLFAPDTFITHANIAIVRAFYAPIYEYTSHAVWTRQRPRKAPRRAHHHPPPYRARGGILATSRNFYFYFLFIINYISDNQQLASLYAA